MDRKVFHKFRPVAAALVLAMSVSMMNGCALAESAKAIRIFKDAEAAMDAGNYEDAVELYEDGLSKDSTYVTGRVGYGYALIGVGDYDNAIAQLQGAAADGIDKADADTKAIAKMAYRGVGIARLHQKDYSDAAVAFREALESGENKSVDADIESYIDECFGEMMAEAESAAAAGEQETLESLLAVYQKAGGDTSSPSWYRLNTANAVMKEEPAEAAKYCERGLSSMGLTMYINNASGKAGEAEAEVDEEEERALRLYELCIYESQGDMEHAKTVAEAYNSKWPGNEDVERELTYLSSRVR